MTDLFNLKGKIIFLTGASGYLGSSIVKVLSQHGAEVILVSRKKENLENLSKKLPNKSHVMAGEVEDRAFIKALPERLNELGIKHIDCIINGAYSGRQGEYNLLTGEDFDKAHQLNITGPFLIIKTLLPFLENSPNDHKSIINIASMYGKVSPNPKNYPTIEQCNPVHYGASKGGMIQMTKYLAVSLAPKGITVNTISPGAFPNPEKNSADFINQLESSIPLQRIGRPEELAGSFILLASKAGTYITGTDMAIDGGWTSW
ncbi:MAG: SDR family oxidoreductase [Bacteriovoracaceae bacterium]|jgi:NAD(P)-dependent dehydrogenase (short-subunit alcohol dehydrogenase family)|nr:SDR family oxidoreductase [Bacteriovoracaceae bacterium]